MEINQIGAMLLFGTAIAIALQGLRAQRDEQAIRTRWQRLQGTVVAALPEVETDSDGTRWSLYLRVSTDEGLFDTALGANSENEHRLQIVQHQVGASVYIRKNPDTCAVYVEGNLPNFGHVWLYMTSIALVVLGLMAWFDLFQVLFRLF